MSIFVSYKSLLYKNRANEIEGIVNTNNFSHSLNVNSIIVCNTTAQALRFNLTNNRKTSSVEEEYTLINQFEIGPYKTVDVVASLGLEIFLEYTDSANCDRLRAFSNGYSQIFNCQVSFTVLKET
jgi:hypothetical protein